MAAIQPIQHKPYQSMTKEELRDALGEIVARTMQEIAKQTQDNLEKGITELRALNKGVYYPSDYAKLLIQHGKTNESAKTRYNYLKDRSHLIKGLAPQDYFQGPLNTWEFVVRDVFRKSGDAVSPSEALQKAKEGLLITDCGSVVQICRYQALFEVLGRERFDRLFSAAHGECLNIGFHDTDIQPMRYFVSFTRQAKDRVKKGQYVCFYNHPRYLIKHQSGMGANYNLVCIDDTAGKKRFAGHGTPPEGFTENQLCKFLADSFNRNPENLELRFPDQLTTPSQQGDYLLRERRFFFLSFKDGGGQALMLPPFKILM